jgi:hypothetical protein
MLAPRFPNLTIVQGIRAEALKAAFTECDFLLHGSGPSLVARKMSPPGAKTIRQTLRRLRHHLLRARLHVHASDGSRRPGISSQRRAFVFFRDCRSLALRQEARRATCPIMEFGPDGAFAVDLRDDAKADAFLAHGLEPGKFLCCIPRLRFTPYWTIPEKKAKPDETKHARNEP